MPRRIPLFLDAAAECSPSASRPFVPVRARLKASRKAPCAKGAGEKDGEGPRMRHKRYKVSPAFYRLAKEFEAAEPNEAAVGQIVSQFAGLVENDIRAKGKVDSWNVLDGACASHQALVGSEVLCCAPKSSSRSKGTTLTTNDDDAETQTVQPLETAVTDFFVPASQIVVSSAASEPKGSCNSKEQLHRCPGSQPHVQDDAAIASCRSQPSESHLQSGISREKDSKRDVACFGASATCPSGGFQTDDFVFTPFQSGLDLVQNAEAQPLMQETIPVNNVVGDKAFTEQLKHAVGGVLEPYGEQEGETGVHAAEEIGCNLETLQAIRGADLNPVAAASSRGPARSPAGDVRSERIRNLTTELRKAQKVIAKLKTGKQELEVKVNGAKDVLADKPLLDKFKSVAKLFSDNELPDVLSLLADALLAGSLPLASIRFHRLVSLAVNCNKEYTNQLQYSDAEMRYFATLRKQSCAAAVLEAMRGPMNVGEGHGKHSLRTAKVTEFVPSLKAIERYEKQMMKEKEQEEEQQDALPSMKAAVVEGNEVIQGEAMEETNGEGLPPDKPPEPGASSTGVPLLWERAPAPVGSRCSKKAESTSKKAGCKEKRKVVGGGSRSLGQSKKAVKSKVGKKAKQRTAATSQLVEPEGCLPTLPQDGHLMVEPEQSLSRAEPSHRQFVDPRYQHGHQYQHQQEPRDILAVSHLPEPPALAPHPPREGAITAQAEPPYHQQYGPNHLGEASVHHCQQMPRVAPCGCSLTHSHMPERHSAYQSFSRQNPSSTPQSLPPPEGMGLPPADLSMASLPNMGSYHQGSAQSSHSGDAIRSFQGSRYHDPHVNYWGAAEESNMTRNPEHDPSSRWHVPQLPPLPSSSYTGLDETGNTHQALSCCTLELPEYGRSSACHRSESSYWKHPHHVHGMEEGPQPLQRYDPALTLSSRPSSLTSSHQLPPYHHAYNTHMPSAHHGVGMPEEDPYARYHRPMAAMPLYEGGQGQDETGSQSLPYYPSLASTGLQQCALPTGTVGGMPHEHEMMRERQDPAYPSYYTPESTSCARYAST